MAYLPLPQYIIRIWDSTTTTAKTGNRPQLSAAIVELFAPENNSH
jgi:hypothetical protein